MPPVGNSAYQNDIVGPMIEKSRGRPGFSDVVSKERCNAFCLTFPPSESSSRPPDERRDGRFPGSPINASGRLPRAGAKMAYAPVTLLAVSYQLTVAGTAPDSHRLPS